MSEQKYKTLFRSLLQDAGIEINGSHPWDIQVHNEGTYKRVLLEEELGLGESYMERWWDADKLDDVFFRILRSGIRSPVRNRYSTLLTGTIFKLMNMQSKRRVFKVGKSHYDLGNHLFRVMLDDRMNYSCGYWKDAPSLDVAQENKLDLICRKLSLESGMRVLDIGCGGGAFGKYAAEKFGVEVIGLTVSSQQVALGRELCKGLPVEFRLQDYRDVTGLYDRIVSVGMIEHVGFKNYRKYFQVANKSLKNDGLMLLHTIGSNRSTISPDPWMHKYIFLNGVLPSVAQLSQAMEGLFVIEDVHSFGADYDRTLMAWYENFSNGWEDLREEYGDTFFRMWKYFLLSCAGAFRARYDQLWQFVLSKTGIIGGFRSAR